MKIPNILKLFGGADIKLKAKYIKSIKIAVAFIIGIAVCFGLFFLVDTIWNGTFVDWFVHSYMIEDNYSLPDGTWVERTTFAWTELKYFLLWTLVITIAAVITIVILVAHFYAKKKVSKTITDTSEMIHVYMSGSKEATEVFPKRYSEISACMAQIKSTIQQHEHMLKEEGIRKNDLVTYLAHDLKTPLTSVIGYLSLLDEVPDMPQIQREKYIHITLDKANRLEKLINEFFEITRYNLQQIMLEKETVDLYYMLIQMSDEFYPILAAHGNTIVLNAQEDLMVYADPIKLARVFNNILKNAIAYSYPNTEIQIAAVKTEREIRISVCNHGKTIPRQRLESIFEKFFRLDDARATNTGGAGLGLAIAKEIVTLHGGTITANSEHELTTFCVTLPIS